LAKLLVVDDDEAVRVMLKTMLEMDSHAVTTAENGILALNCLRRQLPDVVILDIIMPESPVCRFRFVPMMTWVPDRRTSLGRAIWLSFLLVVTVPLNPAAKTLPAIHSWVNADFCSLLPTCLDRHNPGKCINYSPMHTNSRLAGISLIPNNSS
jgi:hypothetical protein